MRRCIVTVLLGGLLAACSDDVQLIPDSRPPDRALGEARPSDAGLEARREVEVRDMDRERTTDGKATDLPTPDLPKTDLPLGNGPLRVMTLNLHCLHELPDKRAQGIALQIQKLDPDAVALQEICETVGSGGSDNMGGKIVAALKSLTGKDWQFSFAKTHVSWKTTNPPFAGYDEGVGVLAPKGSVLASGEQLLYQAKDFPRKVAWAKVSTPRGAFYLYSTHLTISSDWTERVKQVQSILTVVSTHLPEGLPQIVAGDFNDKDWSGPLTTMKAGPPAFTDAWAAKNPSQPGDTIGCPNPSGRIDYIMVRTAALKSLSKVEKLDAQYQGTCLSDHIGLFAELFQN
jgi:endonuclease/exonuclease/phosphatase family metal-dependent hydrolase